MIGNKQKSFPTLFAIKIAISCGLYVDDENSFGNEEDWLDQRNKLSEFQKMALSTDLETSLMAYYGDRLSKTQLTKLELIHACTKDWLLGHLGEKLLNRIDDGRDTKEIAEIFVNNIINKKKGKESNVGLIVELTKEIE